MTEGLRFEGADDVIDVEALTTTGALAWARQMKTRQEPGTWSRADLKALARRWFDTTRAADAVFELVTDAQLGPSGIEFLEELNRAAKDPATAHGVLAETGAEDIAGLSSFRVLTRAGSASALLEHAEARVLRLLPRADATLAGATSRVDRLFREISLCSGEAEIAARYRSRDELAAVLGLPVDAFEAGAEWSDDVAARYREQMGSRSLSKDEIELDLRPISSVPAALRSLGMPPEPATDETQPVPLADAVNLDRLGIVGSSGCGKSVTARQLARLAAASGLDAVLVRGDDYLPWRLDLAVSDSIEDVLGVRPNQATVENLLRAGTSVLVFDGISELAEGAVEALSTELRELRLRGSAARWVGTGRDTVVVMRVLKQLGPSPCFTLSTLDRSERLAIARMRLPDGNAENEVASTVAAIEHALGREASDPLLFSMALSSAIDGRKLGGRVQLFRDLLDGLIVRNDIADPDLVLGTLGVGFAQLNAEGIRSTDRFRWMELVALGAERMQATPKESVLDRAIAGGLLIRSSPLSPLGPAHDSIADFLAARAVAGSLADPPSPGERTGEQLFEFLAELTGLPVELGRRVAVENPMLGVRVSLAAASTGDPGASARVATELVQLMLDGSRTRPVDIAVAAINEELAIVLGHPPEELTLDEVADLAGKSEVFMVRGEASPLEIAARAWAVLVHRGLRGQAGHSVSRPTTVEAAVAAIALHEERVKGRVGELIGEFFAPAAQERVVEGLGPPGLTAVVHPPEDRGELVGEYLPVDYGRLGQEIHVVPSTAPEASRARLDVLTGRTSADAIVSKHPHREAWERVRVASNRIAGWEWL